MPPQIPWTLDVGIVLDGGKLTLKWGESFDCLKKIGNPELLVRSESIHLTWAGCTTLWGIEADVSACQIMEAPNPRAYHIYLPEFHFAKLKLKESYATPAMAQAQMRGIHALVTEATGCAATSYPDSQERLPTIMWRLPSLRIHLSPSCMYKRDGREHHLESVGLSIEVIHEPNGFVELKDEAAQIRLREGKGREVDKVAWHSPYD